MEKVDLTLDSIFSGDDNPRLLPVWVRSYRRLEDIWHKEHSGFWLAANQFVRMHDDELVESKNFFNTFNAVVLKHIAHNYFYDIFGEYSKHDTNNGDIYYKVMFGDPDSKICDRCGKSVNFLTKHYGLCYPCNESYMWNDVL